MMTRGKIRIIVPSHKRPDRVLPIGAIDNVELCIPKSQEAEYRKHCDVRIHCHPDSIKGLALKRQWIYETFGDVFMIDDDVSGMFRLYTNPSDLYEEGKVDPSTAYDLIQTTGETARAMGAFLWGYAEEADRRNYRTYSPLLAKGRASGHAFGLLAGSKLRFTDEVVAVEDYWISLLNAYHHRFAFFDLRFGFTQKQTFKNVGGQADFRTLETEKRDTEILRKYFGDAVRVKKKANRGIKRHAFERMMRLPF